MENILQPTCLSELLSHERELESGKYEHLVVEFQCANLDFLSKNWQLKGITVANVRIEDIGAIVRLTGLEFLYVMRASLRLRIDFDLSNLRYLNYYRMDHVARDSLRSARNLEYIYGGKLQSSTLEDFSQCLQLRSMLFADRPKLQSLSGIEGLTTLEELQVASAYQLTDTAAIMGLKNLRKVTFDSCTRIGSIADLSDLTDLEFLSLQDCKDIESLVPIMGLTKLQALLIGGTTRIKDRDLSPVIQLEALRSLLVADRKEYEPSVASIKAMISAKWGQS